MSPYREAAVDRTVRARVLDPWMLALLFAWVADLGRIASGVLGGRRVAGELGFAALLALTTAIAVGSSLRRRRARRR
jgi:hypothetical protein